jgi:hypothetical protein
MIDEYWESSPFGKDSIFNPSFDEKQKEERVKREEKAKQNESIRKKENNKGYDSPEEIVKAITNNLNNAWKDSFSENGVSSETGGIIIRKKVVEEVNGELVESFIYDVCNYKKTKGGDTITLNYSNIPEGWEICGDFHTHPYSEKEIEKIQKDQPKFDSSPFSYGDFKDLAGIIGSELDQDDISLVKTEKVIYGVLIKDTKKAKVFMGFFGNSFAEKELSLMNGSVVIKEGQIFSEVYYNKIIKEQKKYETIEKKGSGVEFFKI